MKEIPLSKGKFALVDDEDYEWLMQWKWFCLSGYAARNSSYVNGKRHSIRMHREIMKTPVGMEVDHIDLNPLNNQRKNLRNCTTAENLRNSGKQSNNTSGYKGVYWLRKRKKWLCKIKFMGKFYYVGHYSTPELAAAAYDKAAKEFYGDFARPNFQENI